MRSKQKKELIMDLDPTKRDCNRFLLSVAVAKRARQLRDQEEKVWREEGDGEVAIECANKEILVPIIDALEDVKQHKVDVILRAAEEDEWEEDEEINKFLEPNKAAKEVVTKTVDEDTK
jgi:DNA-directed RNA polymerase subunit K/omega